MKFQKLFQFDQVQSGVDDCDDVDDGDDESPDQKLADLKAKNKKLRSDIASLTLGRMQDWEQSLDNNKSSSINYRLAKEVGLDTLPPDRTEEPFKVELKSPQTARKQHSRNGHTVTLDISDSEVRRRTGFKTKNHL